MTVRVKFDSEKKFETVEEVTAEIEKLNKKTEEFEAAVDMLTARVEQLARIRKEMGAGPGNEPSRINYIGE